MQLFATPSQPPAPSTSIGTVGLTGAASTTLASGASSSSSALASAGLSSQLNEDTFMKLLVAELQNQDPMQPTDNAQLMAQMAQFSMVDQLNTLNQTVAYQAGAQGLATASALLGRQVSAPASDGSLLTGVVSSVALKNGEVVVTVDGQEVSLSNITEVASPGQSPSGDALPVAGGNDATSSDSSSATSSSSASTPVAG